MRSPRRGNPSGDPAADRGRRPAGDTGFLPSRHAFGFGNDWPAAPALAVRTPIGAVGIGNAARGLCGGMVFAALGYWHAGRLPPAARPPAGSPGYRYLVRRLINSWNIPRGVLRYYRWMSQSDGNPAGRTIEAQWPRVRAALDQGRPVPLGLVTVASANPLLIGHNHQVAAFRYESDGIEVRLGVYDPNSGPSDDSEITFPDGTAATFRHNLGLDRQVRGFFLTRYAPASPPTRWM